MQKAKIDELTKQLEEATNNWKRALADYQNLEKRVASEKDDFYQFANQQLVLKLLPVLDSLDQLIKLDKYVGDEHLKLVDKQFRDVLISEGLAKIEVLGKDFNPEEMECVETAEGKDNQVIKELRSGYRLKGKIIRVAQVVVGKKKI